MSNGVFNEKVVVHTVWFRFVNEAFCLWSEGDTLSRISSHTDPL